MTVVQRTEAITPMSCLRACPAETESSPAPHRGGQNDVSGVVFVCDGQGVRHWVAQADATTRLRSSADSGYLHHVGG